jgi:hypothetical protein
VTFSGDAFASTSILDTGWTGIAHRAPIITNGDVTVALSNCQGTSRPCGTCIVSGPIPNPKAGAGQLDSQRCNNDTSIRCSTDAPCVAVANTCMAGARAGLGCAVSSCTDPGVCTAGVCVGGDDTGKACCGDNACRPTGSCAFNFGSTLPLAAGGVTTCVVNQFNGAVSGTANVETGDAANVAKLTTRVYNGIAIDNPCPRCNGDAVINDGVLGGLCDGGPRTGLACDGNGIVAFRPDFGTTSLDCPPNPAGVLATLPIDLTNATAAVTRTVTASSPGCGDLSGQKCLCDTCNNINQEPCGANADCPVSGGKAGICGGRRCIGGTNSGGTCVGLNASQCPGGGLCGRPGAPSAPSACLDNTATVNILDCTDTAPVDGEGSCTSGPVTKTCSAASGHGERACSNDADCGGGAGSCVAANRPCFLTGTAAGFPASAKALVGTQTLIANGVADPPMNDISVPTLAAVFCVAPTNGDAVNNVAGLPGPGRVTIKGTAVGLP